MFALVTRAKSGVGFSIAKDLANRASNPLGPREQSFVELPYFGTAALRRPDHFLLKSTALATAVVPTPSKSTAVGEKRIWRALLSENGCIIRQ